MLIVENETSFYQMLSDTADTMILTAQQDIEHQHQHAVSEVTALHHTLLVFAVVDVMLLLIIWCSIQRDTDEINDRLKVIMASMDLKSDYDGDCEKGGEPEKIPEAELAISLLSPP